MIISIFVVEKHTEKKLFRSSSPMTSAQMNYYLTEFSSLLLEGEGTSEQETYNFVYSTTNTQRFGMQVTKDHSIKNAFSTLKFIIQNTSGDLYDALVVIDNTLYGGIALQLELQPIIELDSQEEKIYKMMMENKRIEMARREKEQKISNLYIEQSDKMEATKPAVREIKPVKIESSTKPILVIIKEKLKVIVNKEGLVKENITSGEVQMVITDSKYKHVEIKMKNLKSSFKYSPYLDKGALKKSILRFDRDRGLNKSIPLLKWASERNTVPLKFDFWNDEEDGKFVNIIDVKANVDVKNVEIKLNKENVTAVEIEEEHETNDECIVWKVKRINKDDSKTVEVKCNGFDKDCLFPIKVAFVSNKIESTIDVEKMSVDQEDVLEFEVRRVLEIEYFNIVSE